MRLSPLRPFLTWLARAVACAGFLVPLTFSPAHSQCSGDLPPVLGTVTPLSGVLGWALCTYVGFVVLDSFDCYRTDGPVVAKDRIATVLVSTAGLCHRLAILHEGMIVECGPPKQLLRSPIHPYTQKLVQALPKWE